MSDEINLKVGDEVFVYSSYARTQSWEKYRIIRETKTQWIVRLNNWERKFYKERRSYYGNKDFYFEEYGSRTNYWGEKKQMRPINEITLKEYREYLDETKRNNLLGQLQSLRTINPAISTNRLEFIVKELKGENNGS
jgi:hypothetical protein